MTLARHICRKSAEPRTSCHTLVQLWQQNGRLYISTRFYHVEIYIRLANQRFRYYSTRDL